MGFIRRLNIQSNILENYMKSQIFYQKKKKKKKKKEEEEPIVFRRVWNQDNNPKP